MSSCRSNPAPPGHKFGEFNSTQHCSDVSSCVHTVQPWRINKEIIYVSEKKFHILTALNVKIITNENYGAINTVHQRNKHMNSENKQ
jgi:hypothetical protein